MQNMLMNINNLNCSACITLQNHFVMYYLQSEEEEERLLSDQKNRRYTKRPDYSHYNQSHEDNNGMNNKLLIIVAIILIVAAYFHFNKQKNKDQNILQVTNQDIKLKKQETFQTKQETEDPTHHLKQKIEQTKTQQKQHQKNNQRDEQLREMSAQQRQYLFASSTDIQGRMEQAEKKQQKIDEQIQRLKKLITPSDQKPIEDIKGLNNNEEKMYSEQQQKQENHNNQDDQIRMAMQKAEKMNVNQNKPIQFRRSAQQQQKQDINKDKQEKEKSKNSKRKEQQLEQLRHNQQILNDAIQLSLFNEEQFNQEYIHNPQVYYQTIKRNKPELDKQKFFIFPPLLWTFAENIQKQSIFVRRCLHNMKYYGIQSNYEFSIINSTNYKIFLSHATVLKIDRLVKGLAQRIKNNPESNLKDHYEDIKRRLIVFHVLHQKGGVYAEKNVLYTQKLDWIKHINKNPYANRGGINAEAKYVGFFDIDHGSAIEKHNKSGVAFETEKYMVKFPCFEPYFLAGVAEGEYLRELLGEYVDLLTHPDSLGEKMAKYSVDMGGLHGKDLYYEVLYLSQQIVLRKKQQEIDAAGNADGSRFAVDHFGMTVINERYFPKKLQFTFEDNHEEKVFWNLARYSLKELEETTGPLSYIVCVMFEAHVNYKLELAYARKALNDVHPQSFIGKYVVMNQSEPFLQRNLQKNIVNPEARRWTALPKVIWVYWDSGISHSSLGNKLCVDNIRKYAAQSGFEVRELNDSNVEQHIGKELNAKIDAFIANKKVTTFAQTKSDMVRIAVMAKHGGIYMDASYFALESLEWIVDIARYPSQFVFNRYGELPRVLLLFHPHFGQPFTWELDRTANTKRMWLSAYENNLLIAEPNQQLFWDWLEEYGRFVTRPYEETEQLMRDVSVFSDRWTNKDNVYLAAMDSIKNVVASKEREIQSQLKSKEYRGPKSAVESYGIWSLSGYRGQQKFRAHTNFDNTYIAKPHNSDNLFLWRYSEKYTQGVIGKIKQLGMLYSWNIQFLHDVLLKSYDSNFTSQVHPESYFMKYLYDSSKHKIVKIDGDLQLQYLSK